MEGVYTQVVSKFGRQAASKPRGSIDRKRIYIVNIDPFAIVEPRELSR